MDAIASRLEALLQPYSDVLWFTPAEPAAALVGARTQLLRAEQQGDEEAIAVATEEHQRAVEQAARAQVPLRLRQLSDSEQRAIRRRTTAVQAHYACEPESRAQWLVKLQTAFETEDPEALYEFYLESMGYPKANLEPESIPSPRELLQQAAERYREGEQVILGLCPTALAAKVQDVILGLEIAAVETDWRDYVITGLTIHLTDVERSELAAIDDDDPEYERLVGERYEEFFQRRRAVEIELRRREYAKKRAELEKYSRQRLIELLADHLLAAESKEAAAQHMLLEWVVAMVEVPTEDAVDGDWTAALAGSWRPLFAGKSGFAQADLLAGSGGDAGLLYEFLSAQVKEMLPREESQLIQAATFRANVGAL